MYLKFFSMFLLATLLSIHVSYGQQANSSALKKDKPVAEQAVLYQQILKAGSLSFHTFNNYDTITFKKFFKSDLEFHHDLGGLTKGSEKEQKSGYVVFISCDRYPEFSEKLNHFFSTV